MSCVPDRALCGLAYARLPEFSEPKCQQETMTKNRAKLKEFQPLPPRARTRPLEVSK